MAGRKRPLKRKESWVVGVHGVVAIGIAGFDIGPNRGQPVLNPDHVERQGLITQRQRLNCLEKQVRERQPEHSGKGRVGKLKAGIDCGTPVGFRDIDIGCPRQPAADCQGMTHITDHDIRLEIAQDTQIFFHVTIQSVRHHGSARGAAKRDSTVAVGM